ncbi:hypothetical protein VOI45_00850 [Acidaminococcus fermentans]|uniref:hypothetical protein n=1 Tax=Acidaminococcus fermentans TaxID=905 RepID=UPI002E78B039|nr:hypothetical protein [Acidaminococcus fermentans]MEE1597345.1 hypothetical protein [Acidaminococcus fermentans]MEE4121610.1 hypothetical protein [Acidaminococcus fermentans]
MNFSDFAKGLFPFCSGRLKKEQYFNELIGNFIKDSAMDSCQILGRKPDTKYRYLRGSRIISHKEAKYIYDYRDKKKFSKWIANQTEEFNSYDGLVDWLKSKKINNYPDDACPDLFEQILIDIISSPSKKEKIHKQASSDPLSSRDLKRLEEFMNDFNEILKTCINNDFPNVPMPSDIPSNFDELKNKWQNADTNFKNTQLNSLKYGVINNLDGYLDDLGVLMTFNPDIKHNVRIKPLYPESEEDRKSHQKRLASYKKELYKLHNVLCELVNNHDLPIQKTEPST